MAELEKKPVKIVETVLRDAHQSLIATRLTTEQMLPIFTGFFSNSAIMFSPYIINSAKRI